MEKYEEILKKIVCDTECHVTDFKAIDDFIFTEYGVTCTYIYYSHGYGDKVSYSTIEITNSKLNAYMFEYGR